MALNIATYALYVIGLVASGAFLVRFRPKHVFRKETVLALGFPAAVFLVLLRGVISIVQHHGVVNVESPVGTIISLIIFGGIDALMIYLFVSFSGFRRKEKKNEPAN